MNNPEQTELEEARARHFAQTAQFVNQSLGRKVMAEAPSREDILIGAVIEATSWLKAGAHQRALELLEATLRQVKP